MLGVLSVLGGVGLVCASGVVISSAMKFFHTYEFDLTAKIKDSKKEDKERKTMMGGVNHESHIDNLQRKTFNKQR